MKEPNLLEALDAKPTRSLAGRVLKSAWLALFICYLVLMVVALVGEVKHHDHDGPAPAKVGRKAK